MENLTLEQLKALAQHQQAPSISLYMPTHRAGPDMQQDPIRFKNLLREVERTLTERGMKPRDIEALLQPAQSLLEDIGFWRYLQDGLALFLAPDDFRYYRLPFPVDEQVIVAQSYFVKPILPLFTNNGHYYILAFSQDTARLFEGTRHTIGEIELPEDTPTNLQDALQIDNVQRELQFHSTSGGGGDAMFHGHGAGDEERKRWIENYLNLLDHGVKKALHGQTAPLVLAAVDYLLPMYRKVSEYPNVFEESITGNPEHLRAEELQAQAWPLVEPVFRQEIESVIERYQQFANTEQASQIPDDIITAAYHGRVDSLVVAVDSQLWGVFNHDTGTVLQYQKAQKNEQDLPLLDFAAMQTLQNGGAVYGLTQVEMPTDSPVVAIFRY